jgi:hypothetical protein
MSCGEEETSSLKKESLKAKRAHLAQDDCHVQPRSIENSRHHAGKLENFSNSSMKFNQVKYLKIVSEKNAGIAMKRRTSSSLLITKIVIDLISETEVSELT